MAPEGNDCFYVLVPVPNNQSKIDWIIDHTLDYKKNDRLIIRRDASRVTFLINGKFSFSKRAKL